MDTSTKSFGLVVLRWNTDRVLKKKKNQPTFMRIINILTTTLRSQGMEIEDHKK
jgi:hypothetical protein